MGRRDGRPRSHWVRLVARLSTYNYPVQSVSTLGVPPIFLPPELTYISRFVQMSGMVVGSMIEADSRLREYEQKVRMHRRWLREKAKWEQYEEEIRRNPPK